MFNRALVLTLVSLTIVLVASFVAKQFHTSFGKVEVKEISYLSEDGAMLRGLLYRPTHSGPENPAPAVIAVHGYNNTAEVQVMNSIELSRRGYVVFAIDEYGHGESGFPDEKINEGITNDLGTYSALQYVGKLPYVDKTRIGMVAHSMGGAAIQNGTKRAFEEHAKNNQITIPTALLPTAQAFSMDENKEYLLKDLPVNIGIVNAQFDEWTQAFWEVKLGKDANTSYKVTSAFGFTEPEYGKFYQFGKKTPVAATDLAEVVSRGELRTIYSIPTVHPRLHFSKKASASVNEFFDTTLKQNQTTFAPTQQIWLGKDIFGGIALLAFFVFVVGVALMLLNLPFFATISRTEPQSPTTVGGSKTRFYISLFILAIIPAPLIYQLVSGYPIAIKAMGRVVPTLFPPNTLFPMPTANVLTIFNIITALISLAIFTLVYRLVMKKAGTTIDDIGVKLDGQGILKALLLAFLAFLSGYALLSLVKWLFLVDFRFWVLSIKVLTPAKLRMFLIYLPFFVGTFLVSSLTQNSFTRIRGAKEWVNTLLIALSSVLSLALLTAIDYGGLYLTGVKTFPMLPLPTPITSSLAGVLLWGLLFILPITALIARYLFKKTGSIWLGGFVNGFIVTLFAISNTVVAAGVL